MICSCDSTEYEFAAGVNTNTTSSTVALTVNIVGLRSMIQSCWMQSESSVTTMPA